MLFLPVINVQSSDSELDEDEEIDSEEEDIGPIDAVELIEELINCCNQYENKIVTLRVSLSLNLNIFFFLEFPFKKRKKFKLIKHA